MSLCIISAHAEKLNCASYVARFDFQESNSCLNEQWFIWYYAQIRRIWVCLWNPSKHLYVLQILCFNSQKSNIYYSLPDMLSQKTTTTRAGFFFTNEK